MTVRESVDLFILAGLYAANYKIACDVIRPLLPLLFQTDVASSHATKQLNQDLYALGINYKVKLTSDPPRDTDTSWKPKQENIVLSVSTLLFNLTVSFELQAILLFLFDIAHVMESEIRVGNWRLTLALLTILLCFVIPSWTMECYLISKKALVGSQYVVAYAGILILWTVSMRIAAKLLNTSGMSFMQSSLYQLMLVGMGCLAVLNGTGCITSIVNTYYRYKQPTTKADVNQTADSLRTTDNLIESRRRENADPGELAMLETVQAGLVQKLQDQVANCHSSTPQDAINFAFTLYCTYRVFSILVLQMPFIFLEDLGVLQHKNVDTDPLSTTIVRILVRYDTNLDFDGLSVKINMAFSLCLFIGSFQGVIVTFSKLSQLRTISSRTHVSDLFVAEVSGIYVLATMLLLDRGGLPSHLAELFSPEYMSADFVNVWYDKWFALSCVVCFAALVAMNRMEQADNLYDEEMMSEKY